MPKRFLHFIILKGWLVVTVFSSTLLLSCGKCDEDMYGEDLELVIPMRTYPNRDTFQIGDTLWIEMNILKDVKVFNENKTIRLDTFDFFSQFFISEITDTVEDFNVHIDTLVLTGKLNYLPLPTAIVYPFSYREDQQSYIFKCGIVLQQHGLFWMGFESASFLYEDYEHPAVYTCGSNRRESIAMNYANPSTSISVYESLFRQTKVQYLLDLIDFERYSRGGAITFVVE